MECDVSDKIKRIGVLTGGGDCPGLNAVIRAVAKTAIKHYGLEVVGVRDGYRGLIENDMRPLDWDDVSGILTQGGTILGTSNRANPFKYAVGRGNDGRVAFEDRSDASLANAEAAGIDALVAIGGDGTMSIASKLAAKGLRIAGVPKTIDNDIVGTEVTFGFDTAVQIATDALDRLHTTAFSHHRVMILEVMGRYAGWIALHSGIAGGADVILIPEIPFSIDAVAQFCQDRRKRGRRFSIICVGEGAKPVGGKMVVRDEVEESTDPIRLGGVGKVLADELEARGGLETRAVSLGHILRGGTPTAYDRVLSTQFGHQALEMLMAGESGKLVVIADGKLDAVPLKTAEDKVRTVPADHPLLGAARGVETCLGEST